MFKHLATALEQACFASLLLKISDARYLENDSDALREILNATGPLARALSDRFDWWA